VSSSKIKHKYKNQTQIQQIASSHKLCFHHFNFRFASRKDVCFFRLPPINYPLQTNKSWNNRNL